MSSGFPRSSVLVLGPNSVQTLLPTTLISQAEALLDSHRLEEAVRLADQHRKKLESNITLDEDQAEELRYVYQRIGFQCFSETLFEQAGQHLFNGELDPGILISYYPDLRGSLFSPEDAMDVFAGVVDHMPTDSSVDDIIMNYSPHLKPNTREAPPTVELRKILGMASRDMLESFLKRCRNKRKVDDKLRESASVVDTVLAKMYAVQPDKTDLYSLLRDPHHQVLLSEVSDTFIHGGAINALCIMYGQQGMEDELLQTYSKLIDKEWEDDDVHDPISLMVALLGQKKNRGLSRKWGVWLTKRDSEQGLKLLTSSKRRDKPDEDEALLTQLQESNPEAGSQFLEHLVIQKRSTSSDLHTQLALSFVQQLSQYLSQGDPSIARLWKAKTSSYSSSKTQATQSFFSYFASTTPDSESKRCRLKTILFLQGSSLYDVKKVQEAITPQEGMLKLEMAILHSKTSNHRDALMAFVHDLNDGPSAETYCGTGGEAIPTQVALTITETVPGMALYKHLYPSLTNPVKADGKKQLVKILLGVYMSDEKDVNGARVSRLLESQAANLDVEEVLAIVPAAWSLTLVSSFLARSFRRSLHQRHQAMVVKSLCVEENMKVKEETYPILRDEGMVVEEAGSDDGDDEDELDEKDSPVQVVFNEKAVPPVDILPHRDHALYEDEWGQFQSHDTPART